MPINFKREILIGLAFLAGGILVFGGGVYYLSRDLDSQAQALIADRTLVANRAALLGSLADLKKDAPEAARYQQAMDKILVSSDRLLDFPKWLDDLARIHRVSLVFSFRGSQTPSRADAPGYIGFTMDVSGTAENLSGFLSDAEVKATRFLLALDAFDLAKSEGANYRVLTQGKLFSK